VTPQEFLDLYIRPAAIALGCDTLPHLQIGFGTCGQESGFRDVKQSGGGPALGPWQMEPSTHDSLWANFLQYRPTLRSALVAILNGEQPTANAMMTNLVYAAAMMLVKYLDSPGAIPDDLEDQAAYYVKYYNAGGKATIDEYLANWKLYATGVQFAVSTSGGA